MRKLILFVSLLLALSNFAVFAQTGRADLSLSQSSLSNPIIAGAGFNYQITVTNNGPNGADPVQVVDVLPQGLRHIGNTGNCVEAPVGTLTCNMGRIASDESHSFTISVQAASNLVSSTSSNPVLRNTASVSSPNRPDPDLSNNSSTLATSVVASADLSVVSVEIVNPPLQVQEGESFELTLHTVINNAGPSTPMDGRFIATASSEDTLIIEPTVTTHEELALNQNETRSIDTTFMITCQGDTANLNFVSQIQPLINGSRDGNALNNSATAQVSIDCVPSLTAIPTSPVVTPNPTQVGELEVEIDIRPNNEQNNINLRSNGEIDVAIISDPSIGFDATELDPSTIRLADAPVAREGNGDYKTQFRDVNRDGYEDLVVHIETEDLELDESDDEATLEAETYAGQAVTGTDDIRIVGNGNSNGNGNGNGNSNGNGNGNGNGRGNGDSGRGDGGS